MIYTIKRGDTLYSIANTYGVSVDDIILANGIENPNTLTIGQNIFIPMPRESTYTIQRGDTLYKIAMRFGVSVDLLIAANPSITSPQNIRVGDTINIPDNRKEIIVNGYAVGNINLGVLDNTLPYLTYLSPFSYEASATGELTNTTRDGITSVALGQEVAPIMVVTNISPDGGFDSDIAHSILSNETIQERLISDILSTVSDNNYRGINIDLEYLYPEDRENYIAFLKNLRGQMQSYDSSLKLLVAVAPKYSSNQGGLLYEAHDYMAIGNIADYVIIMTYEWGYMYGEPMAVSPKNEMRRVLTYATTQIAPSKILMGLPNYAYDWTLPFERGDSARPISNSEAISLAISTGSEIIFDSTSQTPYFRYVDRDNKNHIVWFDDARSYLSKLNLVKDFNLAGISVWNINNFFPQLWSVVNSEYIIKKTL